jgi:hypothetical membrane protein
MSSTILAPTRTVAGNRRLLLCAVAVPFFYYGTMLVASALYPGYNHVTQYASELGAADAQYPWVFNSGAVLGGLAGVLGGIGVLRALRALGRGGVVSWLLALAIVANGIGFVFAGLFPMPDERHGGYGIGMISLLGPAFAAIALRGAPRGLRWVVPVLAVNAVAVLAMFAVMMGVGQLVTTGNVGAFQRLNSLTSIPWVGLVGWALLRWQGAPR